jgi:choline dehydrogenase-like flavoprotein
MASNTPNFSYGYPTPGPQNPTGTQIMDQIFFLTEDEWHEARDRGKFDYIVVGSGFCAYAFASRVLETRPEARLLVLERGPFFLPEHFQALPLPFENTIGGLSETFPWTLSAKTAQSKPPQYVKWQHGMVPFFGGRSTAWSAWCPEPTDAEFESWPDEVVAAARAYMPQAKALLNVVSSSEVGSCGNDAIFGALQSQLFDYLSARIPGLEPTGITRAIYAPLAVRSISQELSFLKFSTVAPFLALVGRYGKGRVKIASNCVVSGTPTRG